MEKEKKILYQIKMGEETDKKVKELMQRTGASTKTSAVIAAIHTAHKVEYKPYIEAMKAKTNLTPEERVAEEMALKDAKKKYVEDKDYQEGKLICDALNGTERMVGDQRYCRYSQWHWKNEYEKDVPWYELTQVLVDNQFSPSKKQCIEDGADVSKIKV